jgi:hypothetical protein
MNFGAHTQSTAGGKVSLFEGIPKRISYQTVTNSKGNLENNDV